MNITDLANYKAIAQSVDSRRYLATVTIPASGTYKCNDLFRQFAGRAFYVKLIGNNVARQNAHVCALIGTSNGTFYASKLDSTTHVKTSSATPTVDLYSFSGGVSAYITDTAVTNRIDTGGSIEFWYSRQGDGAGAYNRILFAEQNRTCLVGGDLKIYKISQAVSLLNTLAEPDIFLKNLDAYAITVKFYIAN
jgi:hypothetical protein